MLQTFNNQNNDERSVNKVSERQKVLRLAKRLLHKINRCQNRLYRLDLANTLNELVNEYRIERNEL